MPPPIQPPSGQPTFAVPVFAQAPPLTGGPPTGGPPGSGPPQLLYFNRSGRFHLEGLTGRALYEFFDGKHYSDEITFVGHTTVPNTPFGSQPGFFYNSALGTFSYLFGTAQFRFPNGRSAFLMFMSTDGVNFFGFENTTTGTQRSSQIGP